MSARFFLIPLLLSACAAPDYPVYESDQALRMERFDNCLSRIPKGPESTVYNDWDEVIEACDNIAYHQSKICVKNCPVFPQKDETP